MSKQKQNNFCTQHVLLMFSPCSKLGIFMYWTGNSMDNLLSYYGLVDARISTSEKDLPVAIRFWLYYQKCKYCHNKALDIIFKLPKAPKFEN